MPCLFHVGEYAYGLFEWPGCHFLAHAISYSCADRAADSTATPA